MACLQPDGQLTRCGEYLLLAMRDAVTPETIAKECQVPLFRVRSALREFLDLELVKKHGETYGMTSQGEKKLEGTKAGKE